VPSEVTVDASQQMAATSLQLLSEASGLGSESEQLAVATPTATTASGQVLRPRVEAEGDVNFVGADERLSDYESFSSGDSDGQDIEEGNSALSTPSKATKTKTFSPTLTLSRWTSHSSRRSRLGTTR
jgi:hypothetical protein